MPVLSKPKQKRDKSIVGRVRSYLPSGDGREWDTDSRSTVEGRLSSPQSDDWFVPDPVELEQSKRKYLASDFETKTKNKFDHSSEKVWVRFTPELSNEIDSIISSHKFPIKNKQALIRIAVHELILILRKLEPQPDNHVALLESINALSNNIETILSHDEVINTNRQKIRMLIAHNMTNKARVEAHKLLASIERIQSKELRDRYMFDVKSEFRGIMKGVPVRVTGGNGNSRKE